MLKWFTRTKRIVLHRREQMSERKLVQCFAGSKIPISGVMELIDLNSIEALNAAGDPSLSPDKAQLHLAQFAALTSLKADILEYVARAESQEPDKGDNDR
jgi:hypothetical protein